jgi:hypothetical protein
VHRARGPGAGLADEAVAGRGVIRRDLSSCPDSDRPRRGAAGKVEAQFARLRRGVHRRHRDARGKCKEQHAAALII